MTQQSVPEIQTVIRSLNNWFGPNLIGEMCGMKGAAPLKKWLVRPPNAEEEARLREGYAVFRALLQGADADIARVWMLGMNPHLIDHSDRGMHDGNPVTEIGLGYGADVMAAVRAFLEDPMLT